MGYRQNHMNDDLDKEVLESDSGASGYGQAFITVGKPRHTLAREYKTLTKHSLRIFWILSTQLRELLTTAPSQAEM